MSMNEKGGALKGSNPDFQDDQTSKDLNAFVQGLLKQMQDRFEEMSGNITDRIDEMGFYLNFHSFERLFFILR